VDIRHLQTFQAILEHGNFAKAARALEYGQSTVTLHVQQLETELGAPLFIRRGRKIQLTEAGAALRQRSRPILQQLTDLEQHIRELNTGEAGLLRVGCMEPTASLKLLPLIAAFREQHPKVTVALEIGSTEGIAQQIARGELDFRLCTTPSPHLQLRFEPLFVEELVLLLPDKHALQRSKPLTLLQLSQENVLVTGPNCPYRKTVEMTFLENGITSTLNLSISNSWALCQAVQLGMGVAFVPRTAVTPPPARTKVRKLENVRLQLSTGLVQRHDGSISRAASSFQEMLRQELKK
jgi:LysR family transcriptional regulator, regulator of the ytmI operon